MLYLYVVFFIVDMKKEGKTPECSLDVEPLEQLAMTFTTLASAISLWATGQSHASKHLKNTLMKISVRRGESKTNHTGK